MATSGRIETGRNNGTAFFLKWTQARQDIAGNYTLVNYQAGVNISGGAWWGSNAIKITAGNINGTGITGGTFSNISGAGDHVLTSGQIRINHNADGKKSFSMSITGELYGAGSFSKSGSFDLTTIPRASAPTFAKTLYGIDDSIRINMNRKANFTHRVTIRTAGSGILLYQNNSVQGEAVFSISNDAKEQIYKALTNGTRFEITASVDTMSGNTKIGSTATTKTTLGLPTSVLAPTFSDFGFIDQNTTVKALTGSDKIFIKGASKIKMSLSSTQKMTPKKYATATNYTATFDGESVAKNEASGAIDFVFSKIVSESGNLTAQITAKDSRGLTTTATQTIQVLDYAKPTINATAKRQNNFEETTEISLSGQITPFSGKNAIKSLKYRLRPAGGAWGAYKTLTATLTNGAWSVARQFEKLNRSEAFEIEVEITDALTTNTALVRVEAGVPVFFISSNQKGVGVGKVPERQADDLDVAGDVYARGVKLGGAPATVYLEVQSGDNGSGQVIGSNANLTMDMGDIVKNMGGWKKPANGEWEVPESGIYLITATAYCKDVANTVGISAQCTRGGTWHALSAESYSANIAVGRGQTTTATAWIEKGERVRIQLYNNVTARNTRWGIYNNYRKARMTAFKLG